MSSQNSDGRGSAVPQAECACVRGDACSTYRPGHAAHWIQVRVASSTPLEWVDAIVTSVSKDGIIRAHALDDDRELELWNGAGAALTVQVGEPVAVHSRYHVLQVGRTTAFNVLSLSF